MCIPSGIDRRHSYLLLDSYCSRISICQKSFRCGPIIYLWKTLACVCVYLLFSFNKIFSWAKYVNLNRLGVFFIFTKKWRYKECWEPSEQHAKHIVCWKIITSFCRFVHFRQTRTRAMTINICKRVKFQCCTSKDHCHVWKFQIWRKRATVLLQLVNHWAHIEVRSNSLSKVLNYFVQLVAVHSCKNFW